MTDTSRQHRFGLTGAPKAGRRPSLPIEKVVRIRGLREKGMGLSEIARELGISRHAVNLYLMEAGMRKSFFSPKTTEEVMNLIGTGMTHAEVGRKMGIAEATVSQCKYMYDKERIAQPLPQHYSSIIEDRKNIAREWKPGRYVIGNDAHVRFHSQKCLDAVLSLKGDYDGFIMAGDFIDAYWISSFRKGSSISFASEIESASHIVRLLIKKFGRILYFHGNHEDRLWKQLIEVSKPVLDLAQDAKDKEGNIILAKALADIRGFYFGKWPGVRVHYNWFVEIGQVMVSHADLYSQMQGRTVQNILEHFMNHMEDWDIDHDVHGVLEAHLHRMDGPKRKWGRWLWELPAMCGPLDYQLGARASRGQVDTGFSIMTLNHDGTMNFNESRSFLIDDPVQRNNKRKIVVL
jgi:DNA-binding CsgD family transcriptional regulator